MSEIMPGFSPPTSRVRLSFLGAMEEFRAEGRGSATDDTMLGREIREFGLDWQDPARFEAYAAYLRDQAREDAPRRPGYVASTTLWWVDGDEYLGRLAIRHRLTPRLTDLGGHIGYDVKPSARRRGHATAMLAAALPVARGLGLGPALVTCDESNAGSRRVIEANGGVLEDKRGTELRFWVPTS
jgi:predicted acetyltransferase